MVQKGQFDKLSRFTDRFYFGQGDAVQQINLLLRILAVDLYPDPQLCTGQDDLQRSTAGAQILQTSVVGKACGAMLMEQQLFWKLDGIARGYFASMDKGR